jgi:serine protease Do
MSFVVKFLVAIGKFILGCLLLLIGLVVFIVMAFGGDEFDEAMPPLSESAAPEDPRGFPAPPSVGEDEGGRLLPAPSPFDDLSRVEAGTAKNWSSGTGFAITDSGLWLTAKHVARGCERLGILNEDGRIAVRARPVYLANSADVAIFQTEGGPQGLALDLDESDIKIGAQGFHVGYPQGEPGEVTSRLIGRELMITEGAWRGREDTLAWAETGRTAGLVGTLGGLSGGPAFDARGRVIGITIAENPRRGRIITTAAASIDKALTAANIRPDGDDVTPLNRQDFVAQAKRLRRDLKVVQVICMTS